MRGKAGDGLRSGVRPEQIETDGFHGTDLVRESRVYRVARGWDDVILRSGGQVGRIFERAHVHHSHPTTPQLAVDRVASRESELEIEKEWIERSGHVRAPLPTSTTMLRHFP